MKEQIKQFGEQLIIKTYFECPHCRQQYVVCYDNNSTLTLKKQICRLTANIRATRDTKCYERVLKIIKTKQNRLEREMRVLQTKYAMQFETEGENKND